MRIILEMNLPYLMETSYTEEYTKIAEFYQSLEIKDSEEIVLNSDNLNKIVDLFNDEKEIFEIISSIFINKKIHNDVEIKRVHLSDIKTSYRNTINTISFICHLNIKDDLLYQGINNILTQFFNFIKEKIKNEKISQYSLHDYSVIKITDFRLFNNDEYALSLNIKYNLRDQALNNLKKYNEERCFYKASIINKEHSVIDISKTYHFKK